MTRVFSGSFRQITACPPLLSAPISHTHTHTHKCAHMRHRFLSFLAAVFVALRALASRLLPFLQSRISGTRFLAHSQQQTNRTLATGPLIWVVCAITVFFSIAVIVFVVVIVISSVIVIVIVLESSVQHRLKPSTGPFTGPCACSKTADAPACDHEINYDRPLCLGRRQLITQKITFTASIICAITRISAVFRNKNRYFSRSVVSNFPDCSRNSRKSLPDFILFFHFFFSHSPFFLATVSPIQRSVHQQILSDLASLDTTSTISAHMQSLVVTRRSCACS